jgi:hypothetical protein
MNGKSMRTGKESAVAYFKAVFSKCYETREKNKTNFWKKHRVSTHTHTHTHSCYVSIFKFTQIL